MSTELKFEPRILVFMCNWWTYGAADLAGVSRQQYAIYAKLIRIMCTGRVDLAYVLRAFSKGIDWCLSAVVILANAIILLS